MKLLVVDDHAIVREGLAALLQSLCPDASVLVASDASEGLALLETHADVDVVVLDFTMPGLSGPAAIKAFGRQCPALPVLVLSSSEAPSDVQKALGAGALGYVPKSASRKTLVSAIRLVLSGELYVPPLMVDAIETSAQAARPAVPDAARLTERQIEVLALLSQGQSNKAIAARLNLSEKTVKIHVSAVFRALNVVNRTQAATAGREAGLI
ncbi:DNA-binding NarL/FixJ family response regulator [Rhodoblastus acidophilus]|uniref:response regulator transcription factor n=1 Tax=Rhodoblastus acidophilus TaxID=1074 RepID=UPI002224E58D|nr:response regulator transcription factor [Rhodoblastus acidophilus]MCW2285882.1 DNA-binding NarL/FixJ family response regulator [Rhodoblastus acidophilus]MCW2334817.1 DNA-binding NarL/FixJ family response regulator [Rhodoblastus acidophilus]